MSILVATALIGGSVLSLPAGAQSPESTNGPARDPTPQLTWSELTGGDLSLDLSAGSLMTTGADVSSAIEAQREPMALPAAFAPLPAPLEPRAALPDPALPDVSEMAPIAAPILPPDEPFTPGFGLTPEVLQALTVGTADAVAERPYRTGAESRDIRVESGDTMLAILSREGVPSAEAHALIASLDGVYNLRQLQIGQEITLIFEHHGRTSTFQGLEMLPAADRIVRVERSDTNGFVASEAVNELTARQLYASGTIDSSLYAATNGQGVPDAVLVRIIRAFSYDVDFQRDIRPGDGFELLYEMEYQADGTFARSGDVVYANLVLRGRETPIYLFEGDDGTFEYFKRDGSSVRRALLRTPVDGFRISSGFGMRNHPILGYSRMHRGIDFAAPTGTPIYAAGDGTIDFIGPNSGYGNYVRIRHTASMSTAYAHMSRFASGLSRGSRVSQGQVIGYVGSTGMSTGPHLHYEVLINGSQVNPLSVDLPTGRELTSAERRRFLAMVEEIDQQLAEMRDEASFLPRVSEAQVSDASR